ncbi:hypothetical protein RhiJN_28570 [Ceratobasidium sp. AG-Ba]|nr:hypothetical protein RhiJN_28570 [Ceratobasidium sp. AG-Ba]
MRFQVVMTSLVFAAVVGAQSSGPGTTPIDITGPNMTPPPSTGIASGTPSLETQSPRPIITTASSESAAPTETFPSITGGPSSASPTATNPISSILGSASSALGSVTNIPSSALSSVLGGSTQSSAPNAGVSVFGGVTGWSVAAVAAGVVAGAALV